MKKKPTKADTPPRRPSPLPGAAVLALTGLTLLLLFTVLYMSDVFPGLTVNELVFHLKAPLAGVDPAMVLYCLVHYALPALLLMALATAAVAFTRRTGGPLRRWHRPLLLVLLALNIAGCAAIYWFAENQYHLRDEIKQRATVSTFIEDNYVDPATVKLTFPEAKRNLIYIFLESMETTFADRDSGGWFEDNYIPELTELALENECFNGSRRALNGALVLNGTEWTMGANVGQTAGLPLKVSIGGNDMGSQGSFFPTVTAIGDILEKEGYVNEYLMGSEASFAGTGLYYTDHGNYTVCDYNFAIENGYIPPEYRVSWGFEDQKLFAIAKGRLTALAAGDAPFNMTISTMDTHFEDGFVCSLCGTPFGSDQYANVMACSSAQLADFVGWVQEQDFYEDTTIVLIGDHPTMDSNFCSDVAPSYTRRVYTAVINGAPASRESDSYRLYNTFDMFPTTLAAMGVAIEGDRLGLGVNLYSSAMSLTERFSKAQCDAELNRNSVFMDNLNNTKITDDFVAVLARYATISLQGEGGAACLAAGVDYNCGAVTDFDRLELEYWDAQAPDAPHRTATLAHRSQGNGYEVSAPLEGIDPNDLLACVKVIRKDGTAGFLRYFAGALYTEDLEDYLARINREGYLVFLSVRYDIPINLTPAHDARLAALGARETLYQRPYAAYILISQPGAAENTPVVEMLSDQHPLKTTGTVEGIGYVLQSTNDVTQEYTKIVLDGVDYALGKHGINVVVYDLSLGRVIDSECYNVRGERQ